MDRQQASAIEQQNPGQKRAKRRAPQEPRTDIEKQTPGAQKHEAKAETGDLVWAAGDAWGAAVAQNREFEQGADALEIVQNGEKEQANGLIGR